MGGCVRSIESMFEEYSEEMLTGIARWSSATRTTRGHTFFMGGVSGGGAIRGHTTVVGVGAIV